MIGGSNEDSIYDTDHEDNIASYPKGYAEDIEDNVCVAYMNRVQYYDQ